MNPPLPSGWALATLGELLREPLRNGYSARAAADGNTRVLTLTAVTTGEFLEGNTKLAKVPANKAADLWLESGDILVQRSNTPELVGTARMYRGPSKWAIFPDLLIRVRLAAGAQPEYIELFLRECA